MKEVCVILSNGRILQVCKNGELAIEMMETLKEFGYKNLKVRTYNVL